MNKIHFANSVNECTQFSTHSIWTLYTASQFSFMYTVMGSVCVENTLAIMIDLTDHLTWNCKLIKPVSCGNDYIN